MMRKTSFFQYLPTIVGLFLTICFAACRPVPEDPTIEELDPIEYTPEEQEPVTNDFTMLKACIGKSFTEAAALLADHGFTAGEENTFLKMENGIAKEAKIYSPGNVELILRDSAFDVLKHGFTQWMGEIRNSVMYTKLVRSRFELCTGWSNGYQHFNTPEDLLAALGPVPFASGMSASFSGNDIYYNQYGLTMYPNYGSVYMQIINSHVGQPLDEFTGEDLENADLQKHILISKVDYLTFRYKGFYALNVTDKLNTGDEIPFMAEYREPGDFGYIKLFYRNTSNLLMDGTIIWSGCGELSFPSSFRAGRQLNGSVSYPGQAHISFINNEGDYITVTDESELQRVWQTLSKQEEFRHYYGNTQKKVAVYLYTPSVGVANPADAYYLVFTEQ